MARIQELSFYPIKSFRGFQVSQLELGKRGPRYDREWLLVDKKGGFLTLRQMPHLARIGVRMDEAGIELSLPNLESIDFGLNETEGESFPVTVFKSSLKAFEVSHEVSAWLSEATGSEVRLVRIDDSFPRHYDENTEVAFHDASPLLVMSIASLRELERRLGQTMSMARFRPNIVVDDVEAHAEDGWGSFKVGDVEFRGLKPCSRCRITCTHPLTGAVGDEPLKALGEYRRFEGKILFGYYYAHSYPGVLRVGDTLQF